MTRNSPARLFFKEWFWVIVILALGLILRLYRLDLGLLVPSPNRQLIDATYVRDIYRGNFIPQQIQGLQLYHWIVAGLYWLTGGVHEILGGLVSIAFSIWGAICFYKLLKLYLNSRTALVGLFAFYVLSPIQIIMSRGFQVDSMTLALGIAAIYFLALWKNTNSHPAFFWSWVNFTLAMLSKLSFGYFIFPVIWVFYEKYGRKLLKQPKLYVYFFTASIPIGLWYEYARRINLRFSATEGLILDWGLSSWFSWQRLGQIKFYVNIFYFWVESVVTPLGAVLFPIAWLKNRLKNYCLFYIWFLGGMASIIFANNPAMTHEYYILALAAPSAALIGIAFNQIIPTPTLRLSYASFLMWLLIIILAILSTWKKYALEIYRPSLRHIYVLETVKQAKDKIPINVNVIATSYNSALLWYLVDRPGDYLRIIGEDEPIGQNQTIIQFEKMRQQLQAKYYLISDVKELERNQIFAKYLDKFSILNPKSKDYFRIYQL